MNIKFFNELIISLIVFKGVGASVDLLMMRIEKVSAEYEPEIKEFLENQHP